MYSATFVVTRKCSKETNINFVTQTLYYAYFGVIVFGGDQESSATQKNMWNLCWMLTTVEKWTTKKFEIRYMGKVKKPITMVLICCAMNLKGFNPGLIDT